MAEKSFSQRRKEAKGAKGKGTAEERKGAAGERGGEKEKIPQRRRGSLREPAEEN